MLRRTARVGLCLAVAGCGLVGPPKTGPHGLSSYDGELRRLSAQGRFDEALTVAEEEADAAGDQVLAALNRAIVEHYAGRYEESNELLQAAELEIEERFTKSVSRAALSLVTNDRALVWLPSRAERPMLHVYGALNYLALGEPDEAAVEARRLARVLDGMVDEGGAEALDAETRQLYRSLRYFTGAVFEQAGERNDADVAYRLAGVGVARGAGTSFASGSADGAEHVSAETSGVVVLVESGFVAHRVERSVNLLVGADELDDLRYGSESRRLRFARCFSQRRLDRPMDAWGVSDGDWCEGVRYSSGGNRKKGDKDNDVTYLMRVAWPTMYRPLSAAPVGPVRAFSASGTGDIPTLTAARDATALGSLPLDAVATSPEDEGGGAGDASGLAPLGAPVVSADLSGAVVKDFNRQAPEMLVKSVARAAVKYAVVQTIEDGARKEDDTLADVAAVVGNALAALTERADTRSWTLLPASIQIVRLPLPPGRHEIRVAAEGGTGATLDLGEIEVRPGRVTVVGARAWP